MVYGAMSKRAAKTLVVADHSKFDRVFPSRYAAWRDVDYLVTDAKPEGNLMSSLKLNWSRLPSAKAGSRSALRSS